MEFKSKKEIKEAIRDVITTRPKKAIQALLRLYDNQTAAEQNSGFVTDYNGIGFAGTDSGILTSFAKQFLRKGSLSEKQMQILFKKIGKYAGQLTEQAIANEMYVKRNGVWVINYD